MHSGGGGHDIVDINPEWYLYVCTTESHYLEFSHNNYVCMHVCMHVCTHNNYYMKRFLSMLIQIPFISSLA